MGESLTLMQGIDSAVGWILTNEDGSAPENVDELSVKIQVRKWESPNAPLLAELTTSVQTVDEEVIAIGQWTAEESLAWEWENGFLDVVLFRSGRPVQVVDQCPVTLDFVVSHD